VSYELHFSTRARKYIKKLNKNTQGRIIRGLESLAENPYPSGTRKIMGRKEKLFRIRVGDHRILYEIYEDIKTILIVNIDKRSRVYR